jgi:hypothetical protein
MPDDTIAIANLTFWADLRQGDCIEMADGPQGDLTRRAQAWAILGADACRRAVDAGLGGDRMIKEAA